MVTALQAVRRQLGYTAAQVIDLLTLRAAANLPIANQASLKTKLSRWENGHERPTRVYRRLFRDIYGRTNAELGFPAEPDKTPKPPNYGPGSLWPAPSTRPPSRSSAPRSTTPDALTGTSAASPSSTSSALDRPGDRTPGLRRRAARPALAGALVEASTLAGWQALDRVDPAKRGCTTSAPSRRPRSGLDRPARPRHR